MRDIWNRHEGEGVRRRDEKGKLDIPLSEMMIHIKNAVKVKASGKIRRRTIQRGAF